MRQKVPLGHVHSVVACQRHEGIRYIVCRNEAQAEKDRADRQAILKGRERPGQPPEGENLMILCM